MIHPTDRSAGTVKFLDSPQEEEVATSRVLRLKFDGFRSMSRISSLLDRVEAQRRKLRDNLWRPDLGAVARSGL